MQMPADNILLSAAYLESKGFKFMVDYGTENAVDFAARLMQRECSIISFNKTTKQHQSYALQSKPTRELSVALSEQVSGLRSRVRSHKKPRIKALSSGGRPITRRRRPIGRRRSH